MVPCTLSTAPCTPFLTALEKMLRYPTWIGFIHCRIHSLIHSIPQKGSPRSCLSSLGMICQISKMISIIRVSRLFTLFQPCPIKKRLSFAFECGNHYGSFLCPVDDTDSETAATASISVSRSASKASGRIYKKFNEGI